MCEWCVFKWDNELAVGLSSVWSSPCGLTFTYWECCGLCLDINQLSLPTPFCSALGIYSCHYGPFNCISFHKFSQQLSAFSLWSSGVISVLLVLSDIHLFLQVSLILLLRDLLFFFVWLLFSSQEKFKRMTAGEPEIYIYIRLYISSYICLTKTIIVKSTGVCVLFFTLCVISLWVVCKFFSVRRSWLASGVYSMLPYGTGISCYPFIPNLNILLPLSLLFFFLYIYFLKIWYWLIDGRVHDTSMSRFMCFFNRDNTEGTNSLKKIVFDVCVCFVLEKFVQDRRF